AKMYALGTQFVSGAYGEPGYGKAFYETQAQLARDLDTFYQGQAEVYVGPDGREVKLYALPVDGILYQPVGYKKPVVLNSNEYFVVYDVTAKTGKIVDNRPEIYNLFQARVYDEIWRAMGRSKVFTELSNLCETILISHLHKAHIDQLRAQQVTNNIKTLVHQNESKVWKQVNSTQQLLQFLQHYPKVRQLSYGFTAYVIELPVEGLTWVEQNGTTHVYNPQEHVMLFFEMGSVGIYPRETIENKELFENI
ncbi:MAG: hypothetical protein J6Q05_04295, partial [Elusimicrobiaceae bacterium]|nr:hypothetical protein [Elusimicrobiaceae bacterium]